MPDFTALHAHEIGDQAAGYQLFDFGWKLGVATYREQKTGQTATVLALVEAMGHVRSRIRRKCVCGGAWNTREQFPFAPNRDGIPDDGVCSTGWEMADTLWSAGARFGPPADRITAALTAEQVTDLAGRLRVWLGRSAYLRLGIGVYDTTDRVVLARSPGGELYVVGGIETPDKTVDTEVALRAAGVDVVGVAKVCSRKDAERWAAPCVD